MEVVFSDKLGSIALPIKLGWGPLNWFGPYGPWDIVIGGGAEGALSPLNFDNPKRSKIWYVARGAISRRVYIAATAKCESAAIDF